MRLHNTVRWYVKGQDTSSSTHLSILENSEQRDDWKQDNERLRSGTCRTIGRFAIGPVALSAGQQFRAVNRTGCD